MTIKKIVETIYELKEVMDWNDIDDLELTDIGREKINIDLNDILQILAEEGED